MYAIGNRRGCRCQNYITGFENVCIFCGDSLLECHSLSVICIIVTAGQSIISEQNTAFYFAAEAFASGVADQFLECVADLAAVTIFDAVVAGQVGRSLCGSNQIICCNSVFQTGHAAFHQFCSHFFIGSCSLHHCISNFIVNTFCIEFLRDCDFQSLDVFSQFCGIVFRIAFGRCTIVRVKSCNGIQNPCTVLCVFGNRSDLIQRGSKCHQTITGNSAVGRLQSGNAAERCRLTNGAAGVRTQCSRSQRSRYACCGTAGRTTRHTFSVKRIAGFCKSRSLCGTTHCKFVHACFSQHDNVLCSQFFHYSCIIRRNEIFQHF